MPWVRFREKACVPLAPVESANPVVCFGVRDSTNFAVRIMTNRLHQVAREFLNSDRSVTFTAGVVTSFQFFNPTRAATTDVQATSDSAEFLDPTPISLTCSSFQCRITPILTICSVFRLPTSG